MKYIKVRPNSIKAMQGFCYAVDKANIINAFNSDLTLDRNVNYNILTGKHAYQIVRTTFFSKDRPI